MDVRWAYDGLSFRHTKDETEDTDCHIWQKVSDSELIIHAANLHLFRTMEVTPAGVPLWSLRNVPVGVDKVRPK